jgi:hypothetical protein
MGEFPPPAGQSTVQRLKGLTPFLSAFFLAALLANPLMCEVAASASRRHQGGTGFGSGSGGMKGRGDKAPPKSKPSPASPKIAPAPPAGAAPTASKPALPTTTSDGAALDVKLDWLQEAIRRDLPPDASGEVIVVHLKGEFEEDLLAGFSNTIQDAPTAAMLKVACERNPVAIVLSIDSPGGLVYVMNAIVDRLLSLQLTEGRRVVAWPRFAGSAAAITASACKEIVVRSDSKIGAATAILETGEAAPPPKTALDNKFAAVDEARFRQLHELTKRDPLVVEAFRKPETTLYFNAGPPVRFATTRPKLPTKPPTDAPGWTALDESTSMPLVLTATEACAIGFALPKSADNAGELLTALGLPSETPIQEIRLDSPAVQEATASHLARYTAAWQTVDSMTAPLRARIKKSIHKLRTALDTPTPKNREEARSLLRILGQARATLTMVSDDERESIRAAMSEADEHLFGVGLRIAEFEKIDFVLKDLRGAEELLTHAIKHGTISTQAINERIAVAIQLLVESWESLTKFDRLD